MTTLEAAAQSLRGALQRGTEQRQWSLVLAASTQLVFVMGERLQRPDQHRVSDRREP